MASAHRISWPTVPVKDAGAITTGQQRNASSQAGQDALVRPYFRVANVQDGRLDVSDMLSMPFEVKARDRLRLESGDILLCAGQSRELVGRAAMFNGELEEVYFQNHLLRFRPSSNVDPAYALLTFRAFQAEGVFTRIAKATTNLAHMSSRKFADLAFPLPPLSIQRRLAAVASICERQLFDTQSALEQAVSSSNELLPRLRDKVILEPNAREPNDVSWTTLAGIADPSSPIVYGILKPGADQSAVGGGVPVVSGTDLRDGFIATSGLKHTSAEIAAKYERSALAEGDVLLSIIRNTRTAVVPPELDRAQISRTNARIRPSRAVASSYLYHWLGSHFSQSWLQQRMRGIDMPGLNLRDVRNLPFPLIDRAAQEEKAQVLDRLETEATTVRDSATFGLSTLSTLRRELLWRIAYGDLARLISESEEAADQLVRVVVSGLPPALIPPIERGAMTTRPHEADHLKSIDVRDAGGGSGHGQVIDALVASGGSCTPEELYRRLSLKPEDVDVFYLELRSLTAAGSLSIRRQGDGQVEIVAH